MWFLINSCDVSFNRCRRWFSKLKLEKRLCQCFDWIGFSCHQGSSRQKFVSDFKLIYIIGLENLLHLEQTEKPLKFLPCRFYVLIMLSSSISLGCRNCKANEGLYYGSSKIGNKYYNLDFCSLNIIITIIFTFDVIATLAHSWFSCIPVHLDSSGGYCMLACIASSCSTTVQFSYLLLASI